MSNDEFVHFINLSQAGGVIIGSSNGVLELAVEIEAEPRLATLNRLNPYGAAIHLDFALGLASFWALETNKGKVGQKLEVKSTVPELLARMANHKKADELLTDGVRNLWRMLVANLSRAHRADTPLVEIFGREVGQRPRKWLGTEIWRSKIDWVGDSIAGTLARPPPQSKAMPSAATGEAYSAVHVTIIRERTLEPKRASEARVAACVKQLMLRTTRRDLTMTKEAVWKDEKLRDPELRQREFEAAWKQVKAMSVPQSGMPLGRTGRPRGSRTRRSYQTA